MEIQLTSNFDLPVLRHLYDALLVAADAGYPSEACGLLLGQDGKIHEVLLTRNVHPTPKTHFEIDPQALIDAHRRAREGGPQVLGYFHSHPTGDAFPSKTDRAMASGDGSIWAIIAGQGVRFWLDGPEGFTALSYEVIES